MCRVFLIAGVLALALSNSACKQKSPSEIAQLQEVNVPSKIDQSDHSPASTGKQECQSEVVQWQEIIIPPKADPGKYIAQFHAADDNFVQWHLYTSSGRVCVNLAGDESLGQRVPPKFALRDDQIKAASILAPYNTSPSAITPVDDGWIISFNQGEFGGGDVYWFSPDGKQNYRISSGHQVSRFVSLPDGLYAIEGLSHLDMSEGSIIRFNRKKADRFWQAFTVTKLPSEPYAIAVRRDGTILITLFNSVVSVGTNRKINTLLSNASWNSLYPYTSVLSPDEQKLYIGMHQVVGEFDIATKKFRFLVPPETISKKVQKEVK
jgi:hypothetical protein